MLRCSAVPPWFWGEIAFTVDVTSGRDLLIFWDSMDNNILFPIALDWMNAWHLICLWIILVRPLTLTQIAGLCTAVSWWSADGDNASLNGPWEQTPTQGVIIAVDRVPTLSALSSVTSPDPRGPTWHMTHYIVNTPHLSKRLRLNRNGHSSNCGNTNAWSNVH